MGNRIQRTTLFSILSFLLLGVPLHVHAADSGIRQVSETGITHSLLLTGSAGTQLINEKSEVVWELKEQTRDGYQLDNGNLLITAANWVREFKAGTRKTVWSYKLSEDNAELSTAIRLENGNTMITELGPKARLIEVTPDGDIAIDVPLQPETDNNHMQTRMARKRANGNYIVPHLFAFQVKEYTPKGEVVRNFKTDLPQFGGADAHPWPFTAIEMPDGNFHVNLTHSNNVAVYNPEGDVVWSLNNDDVDGRLADPCGAQRLPNGDAIICSYAQRDAKMPRIFQVTPDKKVTWELFHPTHHAHEVHIITTNGKPAGGWR